MPNKKKKTKPKVLKTKVKDAKSIRFSELQKKLLKEVWMRTLNDRNIALDAVFEDLGVVEKVKQIPPELIRLKMGDGPTDIIGLDILPSPRKSEPPSLPDPPPDPSKGDEPAGEETKPPTK